MGIDWRIKIWPKNTRKIRRILEVFKKSEFSRYVTHIKVGKKGKKPIYIKIGSDFQPPTITEAPEVYDYHDDIIDGIFMRFAEITDIFSYIDASYGWLPCLGNFIWEYCKEHNLMEKQKDGWETPVPTYNEVREIVEEYFRKYDKDRETVFIFTTEPLNIPWPKIKYRNAIIYWNPISFRDYDPDELYGGTAAYFVKIFLTRRFPGELKKFHEKHNIHVPERFWIPESKYDVYGVDYYEYEMSKEKDMKEKEPKKKENTEFIEKIKNAILKFIK